jgi:hypothetical protein
VNLPRLLLDEMFSPRVAKQLRARRHDVEAVTERPDLISLPDEELIERAMEARQCLVTRNISDFVALDRRWTAQGRMHCGLMYVNSSSFPQTKSADGLLVRAIHAALTDSQWPEYGRVAFLAQPRRR